MRVQAPRGACPQSLSGEVGALVVEAVPGGPAGQDREWRAGAGDGDAADLPSINQLIGDAALREPWQLVQETGH